MSPQVSPLPGAILPRRARIILEPALAIALCLVWVLSGCGGSESMTGPTTGSIKVTTSTTGASLDPDGYTVTIDSSAAHAIADNGTLSISQISPGNHQVTLAGLAGNCVVAGQDPRTVPVTAGDTTTTAFALTCAAPGAIHITTSTSGTSLDADGYSINVDSVATYPIGVNDTLTVAALPGDHQVILTDVAANCQVSGAVTQLVTVASGATTPAAFTVTCATPPTTAGTIVFSSRQNGDYDVYTMKADGTAVTNLTNTVRNADAGPQWSADGTKIAFYTNNDVTGATVIYYMNANGSGLRRVTTDTTIDYEPTWAPDGSKMAFTDYTNHHIVVIDSSGANRTQITSGAFQDEGPAWSPDGSKIAFSTNRDGNYEIYVMNADGSNPVRLTNDSVGGASDFAPDWSPDGSKIVFQSDRTAPLFEIYVINSNGTGLTRLTKQGEDDINPTWSPDGSAIVFARGNGSPSIGNALYNVYVMNADGTVQIPLTHSMLPGEVNNEPDWKP